MINLHNPNNLRDKNKTHVDFIYFVDKIKNKDEKNCNLSQSSL